MAAFVAVLIGAPAFWGRDVAGWAALAAMAVTPAALLKVWPRREPGRDCPGGTGLHPECLYVVSASDDTLSVESPEGSVTTLDIGTIGEIVIVTDDSGPFGSDLWWWLIGRDGTRCSFPGGATGEQAAIHRLQQLPGFDNGALIAAMGSTTDAVFVCWRPPASPSQRTME